MNGSPGRPARTLVLHASIVLLVFVVVYGMTAGRGFISDDFRWILESRVRGFDDLKRLFVDTTGFYRPVVSLLFAGLESVAGADPRPYGAATMSLAAACAIAVGFFARSFGLRSGAAVLAASVWLLNPHGINMAVLWISGLTALSLVFFSTTTAIAVSKQRPITASLLFFAALLSKEEAILLPIPLLVLAWMRAGRRIKNVWSLATGSLLAEGLYFWLRSRSDAMTPANAPGFYRFTFDPSDVLSNIVQYADRSLTLSAVVLIVIVLVVRRKIRLEPAERAALFVSAVWIVATFGITIFLPVRSSLYALLPSVGAAVACGAIANAIWREATAPQRRVLQVVAVALPLVLFPILMSRTSRWTELTRVTRTTLEAVTSEIRSNDSVVFIDDQSGRANLENAFGTLLPDALQLHTGHRPEVWLVPAPSDITPDRIERVPDSITRGWRYRGGAIERVDRAEWTGRDGLRIR